MNAMRQAQPRRPAYRQLATSIVNNLTEECLANVSAPPLQISIPSQMSASGGEYLANVTPPQLCASADATVSEIDSSNCTDSVQQIVVHNLIDLCDCSTDLLPAVDGRDADRYSMPDPMSDKCSTEKVTTVQRVY